MSKITAEQRMAYATRKLELWIGNLQANGNHYRREGRIDAALRCEREAESYEDILAILTGGEDSYIGQLVTATILC